MDIANKAQESLYLMRLVEQNILSGNLPKMNFKHILFDYYGEGRDISLPYFTIESGSVKIVGLAGSLASLMPQSIIKCGKMQKSTQFTTITPGSSSSGH